MSEIRANYFVATRRRTPTEIRIKAADLVSPQFKANPYPIYARMRAESPLFCTRITGQTTWLVTRYDDVFTLLTDRRFANDWTPRAPWPLRTRFVKPVTRMMLNLDAPDHTRLRTLVHKAFTPRLVELLRDRIQTVCDDLLSAAAPKGGMELIRDYALPLPLTIIAELLGIPPEDTFRFHSMLRAVVGSSSSVADSLRAMPNIWMIVRYFRKLFEKRRAHPCDDLVTALVQAEESGDKLSEDELVAMVILLLLAGYETTVNLIGSGALALIQHREQRDLFQRNSALAASAVEELLRYTSPLDFSSPRLTREEVAFGNATVPRHELVIAMIGSANHDESQFPDPETLDITREPNKHVAFGQGPHFCLGAPLARLEAQIALTTVFRRLPNLRLAQPPESIRWRKGLVFRGLKALPVLL